MSDKNRRMMMCTIILAVVILLLLHNAKAQIETIFTQNTTFDISTQEGKIRFGVRGTYTSATLRNGTWSFTDLKLDGSQTLDIFKVSARNSNITINSFILGNTTLRAARLRYVIFNGVWLGEGEGWKITSDGAITIKGATGNVSILHYNFLSVSETPKDLPFYEPHSVSITTMAFTGFIAILGIIVRLKTKKQDSQKAVNLSQEYVANKVWLK